MHKRILLSIFLLGSCFLSGQNYYSHEPVKEGKIYEKTPSVILQYFKDSLYRAGDYWGYIHKQKEVVDGKGKTPATLYNLAACYDKLDMPDETMKYLFDFMKVSKDDRAILYTNDFKNLRSHPEKWKIITNQIDSLYLTTVGDIENKELSLKIFYLFIDKYASTTRITIMPRPDGTVEEIKEESFKSISKEPYFEKETDKLLKTYGLPTEKEVGRYGVFHLYDILQHSSLLTKHYPKVKKAFEAGEFDAVLYAMMTDRVQTRKGKEQIYGTQWERITSGTSIGIMKEYHKKYPGKTLLWIVKDFENLNQRRKEMGFTETIEEIAEGSKNENYFIPPEYYEQNQKKKKK